MQTKKYFQDYYKRNREKKLAQCAERYALIRAIIHEYKAETGCITCGDKRHWVLVFHYRDSSQKEFSIGANSGRSMTKIVNEMAKCDVMCANCHRDLHHQEYNGTT